MKLTYIIIALLALLPPLVSVLLGADQSQPEVPGTTTDLFRTFGPAGTVGIVLALGVRWLASRLEASQSRMIDLLTGVIKENTGALRDVQNAIDHCKHKNGP